VGFRRYLSALLACVSALASQTQQQPVFRGGIRLVTVNVTVVDDGSRPVRGLTAADFTVTIDDVRRPVQTVDLLEFGAVPARFCCSSTICHSRRWKGKDCAQRPSAGSPIWIPATSSA
jgi:hypothetical protein